LPLGLDLDIPALEGGLPWVLSPAPSPMNETIGEIGEIGGEDGGDDEGLAGFECG
jgi:hypothetical protein